jgi:diguanylate cyclase (GGDEF)-like protein/PAS domain S-box-containing protein
VAERRRAEEASRAGGARLRVAAERLRLAVEATGLGIWDVDVASGARRWSNEQKAILGLPPETRPDHELFASLIHPDDRAWVVERYRRAYEPAGGGRYRAEFGVIRAADGAERWVEATAQVFFDRAGRPTRGVGTLADVTERRRSVEAFKESEERYRALVETAPDAVYAHQDGIIVLANRQAAALFGAERPDALVGRSVFELVDEASLPLARARTAALGAPGARAELAELAYRRLDGTPFAVEAAAAAVQVDGRLVVQVVFRDVTARKRAEAALQARTAELETVMETVPVAVWLAHDPAARRMTGNRHATELLRLARADNQSLSAPEEQRPAHFRVFKDGREVPPEELPVQRAARGEVVRNEELRVVFDDGSFYDELVSATPVRDAAGAIAGAVGAAIDITERKAAEERVRRIALHDPLTGLPNRLLFHDRLGQALARARRTGERVAVMLLDLDQFKEINDSLGHAAGDQLLREVAARLGGTACASDTWARLGGDEFALVQEGLRGAEIAGLTAGRVLAALDAPFRVEEQELEVGASLGLTLFPDDGETPERLVRNADVALYRAKAAGRGRFEPYRPDMDGELRARRDLQRSLRRALERGELELDYQPVFDLREGRLAKVEALLRWRDPGRGNVPPAAFIPVAEASGLIHPLGEWVLRAACRQAAAWWSACARLKVAVNVSAAQLRQEEFAGSVRAALQGAGLAPGLLELELTESVFLDPSKRQIHDTLRRVARLGVTLVIDDFGTGYSSLAYLRHFPFDEVKIDGSFVADIGRGPGGRAIAAAVVGLAHSLGKRVTAEGVETGEQLAFLRERGCDAAQGYLLGRPAPAEAVLRLLAAAA